MSSGVLKSLVFTPQSNGTLVLTISGTAQGISGSDWGASISLQAFSDQGTPDYGDDVPVSTSSRLPFALTHQLDVTGGVECEAGLYGHISGPVALTVWDVKIDARVIKR